MLGQIFGPEVHSYMVRGIAEGIVNGIDNTIKGTGSGRIGEPELYLAMVLGTLFVFYKVGKKVLIPDIRQERVYSSGKNVEDKVEEKKGD